MFTTNPILLKTLLEDVANGKIQLPDFQRGWVWDDDRIRGLLASISRAFPIGAIMTLSAGGDINFKARLVEGVNGHSFSDPDFFLLDGQQRLTSLYQALLHPGPVDTQDSKRQPIQRRYYIDMLKAMDPYADREGAIVSVPEDRKVTRDFGRDIVLDLSSQDLEYQQHMMPTERFFDSIIWMLGYINYWDNGEFAHPKGSAAQFFQSFNDSFLENFTKYQLPVINLAKTTPKEAVCTVFEKVNTGGVTLTVFELVTATFAANAGEGQFSLREDWDIRKDRLRSGYGVLQGIEGDQFLQAIALLTTQEHRKQALADNRPVNQAPGISCTRDAILSLSLADYQRWANKVETGFTKTAKFLHSQYVFTEEGVPYHSQLIPLAVLYVELGNELDPANAKARLERWYWSGILGEVYGGNVESQFALDLAEVAEYVRRGSEPRLITEASFDPARLLSLRSRSSAAYKGLFALQMKRGATDWRTGEPLTIATWHAENIDIHHIFPKAWCQNARRSIPPSLYNSFINKTPIDARTNRIIGGKSPSKYLSSLRKDISSETLDRVLKTHCVNPTLLKSDNFAACFVQRGEAMLGLIGAVMGKTITGGRDVFQNALSSAGVVEKMAVQKPLGQKIQSSKTSLRGGKKVAIQKPLKPKGGSKDSPGKRLGQTAPTQKPLVQPDDADNDYDRIGEKA